MTDVSSYKLALPSGLSPLDTVQKLQTINANKLKYINDQYAIMNGEISALANQPGVTKNEVIQRLTAVAKTFNAPPAIVNQLAVEFADANTPEEVHKRLDFVFRRGLTYQEKINAQYGQPGTVRTGQVDIPVRQSSMRGGPVQVGPAIQNELPPSTEQVNPNGSKSLIGSVRTPAGPGAVSSPPAAPAIGLIPQPVSKLPIGPVAGVAGPSSNFGGNVVGANVMPNNFNSQFGAAMGPATGLPPGESEAENIAGQASGTMLADMRKRAATFQRDIFPLMEAIPALEKLGTKGTGPGTETLNHLKSFALSNIPGVKESDFGFGTVKDYDKAKKYLTDFVNQTGSTGTNDKLAAAFAGNPSVNISNAAAVDVAKSALALRRMQQAIYLEAEGKGLKANRVARYVATRTNDLDARAFGVDTMTPKAKSVLFAQLKKDPKEFARFENSLKVAVDSGFISPPRAQE